MSIYMFLTQDEIDDLPEDPQRAFATFVGHAQRRFAGLVSQLDPDQQSDWREIEDVRYSFMNVVIAAAKRFEIEPFMTMQVPEWTKFDHQAHRQFQADLDHYLTQLAIDNSLRDRRDSVAVLPKSKDRIRSHIQGLRKCIENASMTEAKREALLKKLDDFERELEKRRLNLLHVTRLALELMALPGGVWASAEIANKLISNVMQTVAEAKAAENETRQLPAPDVPKALSPPRSFSTQSGASNFGDDLDDDIPF